MTAGIFLGSFYQLELKLCFFLVLIRFSRCFPFCSEQTYDGWNFVSSNLPYDLICIRFVLSQLARRVKFAFNIGHFLIILPFHSLLATFQVSISLIFNLFWSHFFGWNRSKVVWGSKLRNTFMHGPSFFSFHFLSFSISCPKLTIFTILGLYMPCKMGKSLRSLERYRVEYW